MYLCTHNPKATRTIGIKPQEDLISEGLVLSFSHIIIFTHD